MKQKIIEMFGNWLNDFIIPFAIAVVIFLVWLVVISLIIKYVKKRIFDKYDSIDENHYSKKVADIVGSMLYYILLLFNILIAFQIVSLNVAILMAGISFGIWFGMEKTLSNMLSWVMLVTNPKIKTWEMIYLLWDYNIVGRIEKLSARNTIIRLPNKKRLILPNKKVTETPIKTFTQEQIIKDFVSVSIDLNSDVQLAKKVLRQMTNEHSEVVQKEKTFVNVEEVTESGIIIKIYFHIYPKTAKFPLFLIKSDLRKWIMKVLRENNISVPYPHQVIDFEA